MTETLICSISENLGLAMAQPAGGDEFSKTVVLLRKEDCKRRNGKVFVPNTIEMAQIKRPARGQYKTNVQFSKIMGKDMVRQTLQDSFGCTFDLMNARYGFFFRNRSLGFVRWPTGDMLQF